jgi:CBS domain-containing protein
VTEPIEHIVRDVRIEELGTPSCPPVTPSTPLGEVYRLLEEQHRGAVVVCESGRVEGIFSERDVLYRTSLEGIDPSTPVGEVMSRRPVTLTPRHRVAEAIRVMIEGGYRNVPLADENGREAGLLTSRDILEFIAGHFPEVVLNLPPRLHQKMAHSEGA